MRILLFLLLVSVSVSDIVKFRIPDFLVYLLFLTELFFLILHERNILPNRFLLLFIVFFVLYLVSKASAGLGMGDVKLLSVLSFGIGFRLFVLSLLFSSVLGIIFAAVCNLTSEEKHKKIPFAPFITAGTGISYLLSGAVLI